MVSPFLKWPGGKRWLAPTVRKKWKGTQRLIEPFVGSGAIFFALEPEQAILSDVNPRLINCYNQVKERPRDVTSLLKIHHDNHSREHYYKQRADEPECLVEKAAWLIYLNRTCFNGMYRENREGKFNVPIGTKTSVFQGENELDDASDLLKRADIRLGDFGDLSSAVQSTDCIFLDPPYTTAHNCNGFVKYNATIFSWDDQLRLKDFIRLASSSGAQVILTNADHHSVREIYEADFNIVSMSRNTVMSGLSKGRTRTTEAVITSPQIVLESS